MRFARLVLTRPELKRMAAGEGREDRRIMLWNGPLMKTIKAGGVGVHRGHSGGAPARAALWYFGELRGIGSDSSWESRSPLCPPQSVAFD